jgi:hypothetical protein
MSGQPPAGRSAARGLAPHKAYLVPPSLGIPDKSKNISQIYLWYILGYISDTSKIYLGYRWIRIISQMYPRYIPDISLIYLSSWIYLEYILDLSRMTDESGIHLLIPHISGIPRLGGSLIYYQLVIFFFNIVSLISELGQYYDIIFTIYSVIC